jgi:glucosamine-phosphate N-acetyltransferase
MLYKLIELYPTYVATIREQYMRLLAMLTTVEPMTDDQFVSLVNSIRDQQGHVMVAYVYSPDHAKFAITGTGTLLVEQKLARGGRCVGHIEDIVVHVDYRKQGIVGSILKRLKYAAQLHRCYKLILDCHSPICSVYEAYGFVRDDVHMILRLDGSEQTNKKTV